ncbi:MAG: DUF1573 domain-containing protein [Chitinophagaceae bacterium]|nr:DUF1573 domain-containing protein [Chitinophagaceae bacterium]
MSINKSSFLWRNKLTIILTIAFAGLLINYYYKKRNIYLTTENLKKTELSWVVDSTISLQLNKNDVKTFKIGFLNSGSNILYIKNVTATCGCTEIAVSSEKIPIGDSAFFTGKIDSKGMQGENLSIVTFNANTTQKLHKLAIRYSVK